MNQSVTPTQDNVRAPKGTFVDVVLAYATIWLHEHLSATRKEKKAYIDGVIDALIAFQLLTIADDVRAELRRLFFPALHERDGNRLE